MLNSISDDARREWWKQSRERVRGVDKYKRNGVFKYNKGGKSKVERKTGFDNVFIDKN